MAQRTASDDTTSKLRAKVRQLEAALEREREARRKLERHDREGGDRDARGTVRGASSRSYSRSDRDRSPESETSRRIADSTSHVSRRARDAKSRMIRGVTLGAFEGLRAWSDAFSSFTDGVLRRNEGRDRSVRDLLTDLPGDIASGFSDAVDDFIDVPVRISDRYSRSYREGEDSDKKRSSRYDHDSSDREPEDREPERDHTYSDDEDDEHRSTEVSLKAETTKDSSS